MAVAEAVAEKKQERRQVTLLITGEENKPNRREQNLLDHKNQLAKQFNSTPSTQDSTPSSNNPANQANHSITHNHSKRQRMVPLYLSNRSLLISPESSEEVTFSLSDV